MKQNEFNKAYFLVIAGGFVAFAFFLTIPLIGLYSMSRFHLSASEAGLLSAVWPATVFVSSFFVGRIGGRLGLRNGIQYGQGLCILAYLILGTTASLPLFIIALVLFGIGKNLNESSIRSAIVTMTSQDALPRFMRLRYLVINIVCVGGPWVGYAAYQAWSGHAFVLSAVIYSLASLIIASFLKAEDFGEKEKKAPVPFKESFALFADRNLQIFILCGTFISISYGAYEMIMPLVVEKSHGLRPDFGTLAAINALTVVVSQFAILRWGARFTTRQSVLTGFSVMAIGFLLFAIEANIYFMTLIATFVFSIGESILFPSYELVLNDLAKADQKTAYFAAAESRQIGFFLGPALGGAVLQFGGPIVLFLGIATLLTVALYYCRRLMNHEAAPNAGVTPIGKTQAVS